MNAATRELVYVALVVSGFVALVAAIYAGYIDPSKLAVSIKDAATVTTGLLSILSGLLAVKHLTPDA
jgi:energy-converting hydrogenase Eha subunit C